MLNKILDILFYKSWYFSSFIFTRHPEAPFRFLCYNGPFRAKFNTDVVISCGECHSVRTSLLRVVLYINTSSTIRLQTTDQPHTHISAHFYLSYCAVEVCYGKWRNVLSLNSDLDFLLVLYWKTLINESVW